MPCNSKSIVKHLFATIGSLTARGGRITSATSRMKLAGLEAARVGDTVTYPDGSEAVIIYGAGFGTVSAGKPVALVGSSLSNGDKIIETLQPLGFGLDANKPIVGLFGSNYLPPPAIEPGEQNVH